MDVRQPQKFDELRPALAVAYQAHSMPQINARPQGQRAVAKVLRIAAHRRVLAGNGGQVRSPVLQGLNPRLLVVRPFNSEGTPTLCPISTCLYPCRTCFILVSKSGPRRSR